MLKHFLYFYFVKPGFYKDRDIVRGWRMAKNCARCRYLLRRLKNPH